MFALHAEPEYVCTCAYMVYKRYMLSNSTLNPTLMPYTHGGLVAKTFHSSCRTWPSFGTSKMILSALKAIGCSGPLNALFSG